jgi:hypothetical protein
MTPSAQRSTRPACGPILAAASAGCAAVMLAVSAASIAPAGAQTAAPAGAEAAAPAPLHERSFVVSWGEHRIQRHVGEPNFRPVRGHQTLSIYVSSAGRVFSRLTFATRAGTASVERVQGDFADNPRFRQWVSRFGDNTMSLSQTFRNAERLVEIEFDADLKGCKAKVSYVPDSGARSSFGFSPITKKKVEFQSIEMSGESCAVRAGNVFQGD